MRLPISEFRLIELAKQTSNPEAVIQAINQGVFDFLIEAWTCYAAIELRNTNFLDRVTPVGGLDLGGHLIDKILDDFVEEKEKQEKLVENKK